MNEEVWEPSQMRCPKQLYHIWGKKVKQVEIKVGCWLTFWCANTFASEVVAPPQRPTAAILYSNPLGCPCTLTGDLHGEIKAPKNRIEHLKYQGRLQTNTLISVPDSLSAKCCQGGAIWEEVFWCLTSAREVPHIFGAHKVSRWCHLRNYNLVPNKCQGGAIWEKVFWCPQCGLWHRLSTYHNSPQIEEFPSSGLYIAQGYIQHLVIWIPSHHASLHRAQWLSNCLT